MANDIKDFSRVVAELEDGSFNADCSAKLQESLKALQERCDIDGMRTAKAQITVGITLVLDSGNIMMTADVQSKNPPKPRNRTIFWLSEDGKGVCRENPKQPRLPFECIAGKREIVAYDQERKDING